MIKKKLFGEEIAVFFCSVFLNFLRKQQKLHVERNRESENLQQQSEEEEAILGSFSLWKWEIWAVTPLLSAISFLRFFTKLWKIGLQLSVGRAGLKAKPMGQLFGVG